MSDDSGLKSIVVKAETGNSVLGYILGTFGFTEGVDLVTTDNQTLIDVLVDMPEEGDPSYTFSVSGAIAAAISGYEGTHTFTVTATNMNGKSSEGSLTFSITNSTAGGE